MNKREQVRIAGERTIGDWEATRDKLIGTNDIDAWKNAYADFFMERMKTRYFYPIDILKKPDSHTKEAQRPWRGEGFAIVALQCSLIEFLGATIKGQTYILKSKLKVLGRKQTNEEYVNSGKMFVGFLRLAHPFKDIFVNKDDAWDFYISVRCGLLHEARTRNNWRIWSRKSPALAST